MAVRLALCVGIAVPLAADVTSAPAEPFDTAAAFAVAGGFARASPFTPEPTSASGTGLAPDPEIADVCRAALRATAFRAVAVLDAVGISFPEMWPRPARIGARNCPV